MKMDNTQLVTLLNRKVYLEGVLMPKGCGCCKFLIRCEPEKKYLCGLTYKLVKKSEERDKSCPLREEK